MYNNRKGTTRTATASPEIRNYLNNNRLVVEALAVIFICANIKNYFNYIKYNHNNFVSTHISPPFWDKTRKED